MKHEFDFGYEQTFYRVRDSIPGKSFSTSYSPRLSISQSGYFYVSLGVDWLQYSNSYRYFSRPVYSSRGTDTVITGKFSKPSIRYELGPSIPIRIELKNSKFLYVIPGFMMGIGHGWEFEAKGCRDCSKEGGIIFDGISGKLGSKFIYGRNGRGISLTINYEYPVEFKNGFIGMAGRQRPVHEYGIATSIGYSIISEK